MLLFSNFNGWSFFIHWFYIHFSGCFASFDLALYLWKSCCDNWAKYKRFSHWRCPLFLRYGWFFFFVPFWFCYRFRVNRIVKIYGQSLKMHHILIAEHPQTNKYAQKRRKKTRCIWHFSVLFPFQCRHQNDSKNRISFVVYDFEGFFFLLSFVGQIIVFGLFQSK